MSISDFMRKLFANDGAGKELREDILPNQSGPYLGEMRFSPLRPDELSKITGWYHMNGDMTLKTSPQGMALLSLSENFRNDWGIVLVGDYVPLPDWYAAEDGRGYFMRAGMVPGVIQEDMIRNITGLSGCEARHAKTQDYIGALYGDIAINNNSMSGVSSTAATTDRIGLDASRIVPTGPENRPVNRAMTPIMFLGC
jgi:hypothetical protein